VNTTDFALPTGSEILLMQPVHCIPIETLPGPVFVMQAEIKQRQYGFVDAVFVEGHEASSLRNPTSNLELAHLTNVGQGISLSAWK
jgi:hypothetical protein